MHEGANKPSSSMLFDSVDEPVIKVATFLPASDEIVVDDVQQLRQVLNTRLARLAEYIRVETDDQLISVGGTTSPGSWRGRPRR